MAERGADGGRSEAVTLPDQKGAEEGGTKLQPAGETKERVHSNGAERERERDGGRPREGRRETERG